MTTKPKIQNESVADDLPDNNSHAEDELTISEFELRAVVEALETARSIQRRLDMARKTQSEAAPDEPIEANERLSDIDLSDTLREMKRRLWGLRAALYGIVLDRDTEPNANGAYQLCEDVCDQMEECVDAFEAERQLRMEEAQRLPANQKQTNHHRLKISN